MAGSVVCILVIILYILICTHNVTLIKIYQSIYNVNISSRFASNPEASASELLENLE